MNKESLPIALHCSFEPENIEIPKVVDVEPRRKTFRSGAIELSYIVWGNPDKPPVMLVHGGSDHNRNWDWTVRDLVADYCLIAPDLRGHGDSGRMGRSGYDTPIFVVDMIAFIEHLEKEGFDVPMPLIGHSLGGNIVLNYAAIAPEKVTSVFSMEGLGPSQKLYDTQMSKSAAERLSSWAYRVHKAGQREQRHYNDLEEMVERMASVHKNLSPEQARHLALHAARKGAKGWHWKHDPTLTDFFPQVRMTPLQEYSDIFSAIECPVWLTRGETSWASDPVADGRADCIKNMTYKSYPDAGHWHHHDAFDLFIADVKQFLKETS